MTKPEVELPELTPEQEDAITARRLRTFAEKGDGWLPYDVFRAVGLVTVRFTVEVAFVKPSEEDEEDPEVLLTQRPPTDEDIPNQWHIPGATVFPLDPVTHYHDNEAVIGRVRDEAGGTLQIVGQPLELDTVRRTGAGRSEVTTQYMAHTIGRQEEGRFFNINNVLRDPPEHGLVDTHADTIERVAYAYQSLRGRR